MGRLRLFLPLCGFLLLVLVLWLGFSLNDPHILPSALLEKPFPRFELPDLQNTEKRLTQEDLKGKVLLVNVWATWCPTCKAEHAELMRLKQKFGLEIAGIVYKDEIDNARRWLTAYGDPYIFNIVDGDGRLGIDLGVYGAPESFLVNAEGKILYKRVGEVNARIWRDEIRPRLEQLEYFDSD